MIIETIDIHGHERIINANFITNIEYTTTGRGSHGLGRRNPCSGAFGDQLIRLYMSTSQVIEIACDHDGNDVTEALLNAYKRMMHGLPETRAPYNRNRGGA